MLFYLVGEEGGMILETAAFSGLLHATVSHVS